MSDLSILGPWIRRFLMEHIVEERNLARNTQTSYRDTLCLLLPFVANEIGKSVDKLSVEHLSPEVLRRFLSYLEQERKCLIATRNQRLAAIHALARFIGERSPEHIAWCTEIRSIPFKKTSKASLPYLDKLEMDALLEAPNQETAQGRRDYALLLFLYNSGARADEAAHVTIADLDLGGSPAVKIHGKGNKTRLCPLWPLTAKILGSLIVNRAPDERAFLNRRGQPITRYGIHTLVKRHVCRASRRVPSMELKKVSPHTIRHTTAVHLLRAGVDINTIRAWLGHVSLDTTHIYTEIDLEMKAKALARCEVVASTKDEAHWHDAPGVMAFLKAL